MTKAGWISMAVVGLLGLGGGAVFGRRPTLQPYTFNHAVHTKAADCTLCHRGAREGARAGLPDPTYCTGCHAQAPGASPTEAETAFWAQALEGEAPAFKRLFRLPTHVYFSHRRHVTIASIECTTCHGDMGSQTAPPDRALKTLTMRRCIECHNREAVIVDCTACHR